MDLDQALAQLQSAEARYSRRTVPAKHIHAEGDYLLAGSEAYRLSDDKTLQILCRAMGLPRGHVPDAYLQQLPVDLRARLLQHHLNEGALHANAVVIVTDRERKQLIALDRADLFLLPASDVLQAVIEGIGGQKANATIKRIQVYPNHFTFDVLSSTSTVEPRPNDIIQAGLHVSHSFLGAFATEVDAYIERLACTNGAVSRTCIDSKRPRTRRLPVSNLAAQKLQREQIRMMARHAWRSLKDKLQTVTRLVDTRFDNERDVVNRFRSLLRQNRLSVRQGSRAKERGSNILERLRAAWREEGEERTAYGVMNAVTRLATHDQQLSLRERFTLMRLGGLLAFEHYHICPRCFSLITRDVSPEASIT